MYIEGQTDAAIAKARELVEAKVGGRPMDKDGDDFVYVNTRAIGFLLGKGGADLKKMCETSGARIQVASAAELETGSIEIKVRLMGEPENVKAAKALLLERMQTWHTEHVSDVLAWLELLSFAGMGSVVVVAAAVVVVGCPAALTDE